MNDNATQISGPGLKFMLRALRHRNYRLFFFGQGISITGSWMQVIAVSWLAYRMTNSVFLLGLVGFASQVPIFVFTPIAGVLADRWDRKRLLLITQIFAMIQAFILAFLALRGIITISHILILSTLLGLVNSFDMPIRNAFVLDMIENKNDLGNAIALNSIIFNGARLIGPPVAGILIAAIGEGMCFLFNGLSFLAVIFALMAMRIRVVVKRDANMGVMAGLKEGFDYVLSNDAIRAILLLIILISLIGMSYVVLMPVLVKELLNGGAETLGFLMGAMGVGAVMGAIYLASRTDTKGLSRVIPNAAIVFGISLAALSLSRSLWLSLLLMLCVGFGMITQLASSNTLLQDLSHDDKRGRVMGFYTMAFIGMAPFGSLLAGTLANNIGAPNTLFISGVLCVMGALFFAKFFKKFI